MIDLRELRRKNLASFHRNKEKYHPRQRAYYFENKEAILKKQRAYYKKNQAKILARKKIYRVRVKKGIDND